MEETQKKISRRSFLKTAAVAATFTIVSLHVLGGKRFLAPSDKLYIVGVGEGGKDYSDLKSFHNSGKVVINETKKNKSKVTLHLMDGGIQPERSEELVANEIFVDGRNGMLFIGTKSKMMADTYNLNARLLPLTKNEQVKIKQTIARVPNPMAGHYCQWIEACIAAYGNKQLSSPFEKAVPLTEALLMANLAISTHDIKKEVDGKTTYPARNIKLLWDNEQMKVTNFVDVNQFVKREYRKGWTLGV